MKNFVSSVFRAFKILELIGEAGSKGITEVSKELNIPKSTSYQIIMTLVDSGILEKDKERNHYHLGSKLFQLANLSRYSLQITQVSIAPLKQLNEQLDETIHLTVLVGNEVLYLNCFESTKRLRTHSAVGEKAPLYSTGVGKAVLAFQPPEKRDKILREINPRKITNNTIINKEALQKELDHIVQCGFAIDNSENEDGVGCVAVPIWDHEGIVIASISVSGPTSRILSENKNYFVEALKKTALAISLSLGYREVRK